MSQFDRGTSSDLPTVCADPRCTTSQTCQREKHERYGNAPGVSYGPRCVPLPHPVRTAEEERADVLAFIERALKYPFPSDGSAARPQSYIRMLHEMISSGDHLGAAKREKTE
jgi:hypothetical protein